MRQALVVFWVALSMAACARVAPLQVSVDRPCILSYRIHGQAQFQGDTPQPVLQQTFNLDVDLQYDVRADGPGDFLHTWHGQSDAVAPGSTVHVAVSPSLDAGHLVVLLLGVVGASTAGFVLWRRRPAGNPPAPPPVVVSAAMTSADAQAQLFPLDGSLPDRIASYRIEGLLGNGGMAVVYRAQSSSGEQLALKVPLPAVFEDPMFQKRFGRELKIAASLSHPNLVRIVDLNDGSGAFPYPFLVMEWVKGQPLHMYLGPDACHSLENVVLVGVQSLSALHHAHQHGVIHRDVKPGNMMITEDGQVRVMDFGIARTDGTRLTGTEETLGTPLYMAPEQIDGTQIDARTDIYALGSVLYHMVAGVPPFFDPNYLKLTIAKLREEAPPLSARCPGVDPGLERCIMQMLARRPEQRYWTADEAAAALRTLAPHARRFSAPELDTANSDPTLQV